MTQRSDVGWTAEEHARCPEVIDRLHAYILELRDVLSAVEENDRSLAYEYGEANRNGVPPKPGQRWKTPREIARDVIAGDPE